MRKFLIGFLIVLLVLAGGALFLVMRLTADQNIDTEVSLVIDDGSSTAQIANTLETKGLIANTYAFRFFAHKNGVDKQFKAGEYTFAAGEWSMAAVCNQLVTGGISSAGQIRFTITEGLRAKDICAKLVELGLVTEESFYEYTQNGAFSYAYLPAAGTENRLEGFLCADTYMLDPEWTEVEIVDMLLAQFDKTWTEERQAAADARGMTVREVITMASIVEREAILDTDRATVASVFYNRLAIDMMLQSNVTVEYAMGEWKLDLTHEDIKIDSPYNTYLYTGLPPGPVCSPGSNSIEAALHPEETDYLYFWGQADGSTRFSHTLEEHISGGEGDL